MILSRDRTGGKPSASPLFGVFWFGWWVIFAWPAASLLSPRSGMGQPTPTTPRRWAETALAQADSLLAALADSSGADVKTGGRGWDLEIERLWALYHLAVEDKEHLSHLGAVLTRLTPRAPTEDQDFITGLWGARSVLQARHARWPPTKLEHLKEGLRSLDQAVARSPRDPRLRYLRLVSGYHLPAFLGRGEKVQADFQALFLLLQERTAGFPSSLYPLVVGFVLERGAPPAEIRAELVKALGGGR